MELSGDPSLWCLAALFWLCGQQMAIMLELNHPNIIKLLDFFEKKDHYYMVVEKVRGEERKHASSHFSCY